MIGLVLVIKLHGRLSAQPSASITSCTGKMIYTLPCSSSHPFFTDSPMRSSRMPYSVLASVDKSTRVGNHCSLCIHWKTYIFIAIQLFNATATALNCISQICCLTVARISCLAIKACCATKSNGQGWDIFSFAWHFVFFQISAYKKSGQPFWGHPLKGTEWFVCPTNWNLQTTF